jgi:hypothetical protein
MGILTEAEKQQKEEELEADSSPATDLTSQITGRRRIVRGGESLPPSMLLFMDFSSWLSYVASPH